MVGRAGGLFAFFGTMKTDSGFRVRSSGNGIYSTEALSNEGKVKLEVTLVVCV